MNTILTDDEIVAINERHYDIAFRNFESDVAIARAIEAAVLAKLREQDKRWAERAEHLLNVFDAAPEAPAHPFKEWFGGAETARPHCATCGKTRAEHTAPEALGGGE